MKASESPGESRKPRILLVINQFYKGGAEVALLSMLESEEAKGYQVDLLIYEHYHVRHSISMIHSIPEHVNVCSALSNIRAVGLAQKLAISLMGRIGKDMQYSSGAMEFVEGREYDVAISYGEWFLPDFVVKHVDAKVKCAWIHADLLEAAYFKPDVYFRYDDEIDYYIFPSLSAQKSALREFPFMEGRSTVIRNPVDGPEIRRRAMEKVTDYRRDYEIPLVVTVANVRPEKNHLKQLEVMKRIFESGRRFKWINIGNLSNRRLVSEIRSKIRQYGLEDDFILLGARDNPYKYMGIADVVAVLSDSESWGMVISEGRALGKTVLATRTGGAVEQSELYDGILLCGPDVEGIAEALVKIISRPSPGDGHGAGSNVRTDTRARADSQTGTLWGFLDQLVRRGPYLPGRMMNTPSQGASYEKDIVCDKPDLQGRG